MLLSQFFRHFAFAPVSFLFGIPRQMRHFTSFMALTMKTSQRDRKRCSALNSLMTNGQQYPTLRIQ